MPLAMTEERIAGREMAKRREVFRRAAIVADLLECQLSNSEARTIELKLVLRLKQQDCTK
jgi:hypothetical protein